MCVQAKQNSGVFSSVVPHSCLGIKLYKLNISVRDHVSMMLICNAMGEALPLSIVSAVQNSKKNLLQGSPPGMLSCRCFVCHACDV